MAEIRESCAIVRQAIEGLPEGPYISDNRNDKLVKAWGQGTTPTDTAKQDPTTDNRFLTTYTYKRAFQWNTFDLGYPSAIAVVSFVVVATLVLLMTWLFRRRDRLEF